jgi:pimeloyl-ACP methyl ester carboxylesterase
VYRIIQARRYQAMKNIVLVHGGFVDGAGWEGVYKILKGHGYKVSIVQNPTISLEDDVAVTKRILATQDGPTILVGHSYGGAVIRLLRTRRPARPYRRYCRRKTAFCSLTGRSFLLLSQPTWTRKKLRLWLTPKFRGAWGPLAARSANRMEDVRQFRPGTHQGILLVRLHSASRQSLINRVVEIFETEKVI